MPLLKGSLECAMSTILGLQSRPHAVNFAALRQRILQCSSAEGLPLGEHAERPRFV